MAHHIFATLKSPLNILLVEDNRDDAMLFCMALEKANVPAKMQTAWDGVEAMDYLKGNGKYSDRHLYPMPDVILLDINMPRANGFEVLDWIRKDPVCKTMLVHVFTASCRDIDVRRAYELSANSYAVKPSRSDELVVLIRSLVLFHTFVCIPKLAMRKAEAMAV